MCHYKRAILSILCLFLLGSVGRAAEPGDWDDPSWQLLREAHIHRDAASLAAYLRDQCGADADLARIDALIKQLSSPDFTEREQASKALVAIGPAALSRLRAARDDSDAEVSLRAKECLSRIGDRRPELTLAAVRVLIRRGGPEAVPALVRLLPYADFEELQDDLWFGLDALTVRQGKIDPSLVEALHDSMAVRRAAAACVVGRRGDADQRGAVRKLLTDADPEVRLRAAQGLLAAKDASGVPALTALLDGTPMETAWQAEELLRYIAGAEAPPAILGAGAVDDRRACREAWEAWWKQHGPKMDLAKLDGTSRRPGLMLLCDGGLPEEATGHVWLLGCDGVTRWELNKLSYPADARLITGNRLVIAERSLEPLVEIPRALPPRKRSPEEGLSARDLKGKVLWRYRGIDGPTIFQRLPNGNWLVLGGDLRGPMEISKPGAIVRQGAEVSPDGAEVRVAGLTLVNSSLRMRESGGLLWGSFVVNAWAEIQPDGATLTAGGSDGFVREYDPRSHLGDGMPYACWQCQVPGAFHAIKLPSGNILIAGMGRVLEMDRENSGRVVWSVSFEDQAQRVQPCLNRVRLGFDAPRVGVDFAAGPPDWLRGLASKDSRQRRRSVDKLRRFVASADEAVPALTLLLKDSDEAVRASAGRTLRPLSHEIDPKIRAALKNKDPRVRTEAMEQVSYETEVIISLLKDEDAKIRSRAAVLFYWKDFHAKKAVPALIAAARDDNDPTVRQSAYQALGTLRIEAKSAVPTLLDCLEKDPKNYDGIAAALAEIDPLDKRIFPTLIEAVQKEKANWQIAGALGRCQPRANEVVAVFVKILKTSLLDGKSGTLDSSLGRQIFKALGRVGPEAKAAVPVLRAVLRDKSIDLGFRREAAHTLGEIGSAAKEAIPELKEAIRAKLFDGRVAEEALEKIQDN